MKSKTEWKRFHKNPSTACGGPPPLSGEAVPAFRLPFVYRLPLKGELAPQVTEGCFRKLFYVKQKIPQEPLHQLRWSSSPKGEAISPTFRLPFRGAGKP